MAELLEMQEALATTHNSHPSLRLAAAAAGRTTQAQPQAVLVPEVEPAQRTLSSLEPTEPRDKVLRAEIHLLRTSQPTAQAVVVLVAWAKMA
jgi:hypothetical protein